MPHPSGLIIVMDGRTTDPEEISEEWVVEDMVVIGGATGKKYFKLSIVNRWFQKNRKISNP